MRYRLVLDVEGSHVNFVLDGTENWNTGRDVAGDVTEAEASIIAFALNAVAGGHRLMWIDEADRVFGRNMFTVTHPYDGPTEGVAP